MCKFQLWYRRKMETENKKIDMNIEWYGVYLGWWQSMYSVVRVDELMHFGLYGFKPLRR